MRLYSATVVTPVGPFTLISSDDGVHAAGFTADVDRLVRTLDRSLRT